MLQRRSSLRSMGTRLERPVPLASRSVVDDCAAPCSPFPLVSAARVATRGSTPEACDGAAAFQAKLQFHGIWAARCSDLLEVGHNIGSYASGPTFGTIGLIRFLSKEGQTHTQNVPTQSVGMFPLILTALTRDYRNPYYTPYAQ